MKINSYKHPKKVNLWEIILKIVQAPLSVDGRVRGLPGEEDAQARHEGPGEQ